MEAEGIRKKQGWQKKEENEVEPPDISPRIAVAIRAPSQQRRWRRDASITLNLLSAFSAVCPLSLFVVATRGYATTATAV